jgi:outer membrane protein assembly factor BamB
LLKSRFTCPALLLAALLSGRAVLAQTDAERILELSGIQGGVVVHCDCGDGRLTAALSRSPAFVVQGLSRNPGQVEQIRQWLGTQKLPGDVTVVCWQENVLPYADNVVNLLVVEGPALPPMEEIMRVLTPLGVACVREGNGWRKTVKPWPESIDEWTHWLHGADGNPVAHDTVVGPPRRVQWISSPEWPKSHDATPSLTGMVTAQGRLFYIADTGPMGICDEKHQLEWWHLCARDAFNGVLLWELPVEDWGTRAWSPGILEWSKRQSSHSGGGPWMGNPRVIHKRLVAHGQHVYVTLGFRAPVSQLDAATGAVLHTYDGTVGADEIVFDGGVLFLAVNRGNRQTGSAVGASDRSIMAVDPESGRRLWEAKGLHGVVDGKVRATTEIITRLNVTVGGGKVFALDHDAIVALDSATGRERWRVADPSPAPKKTGTEPGKKLPAWQATDWVSDLLCGDGVLYRYRELPGGGSAPRIEVQALSAEDGSQLWQKTGRAGGFRSMVSIYLARGLLWLMSDPGETPRDKGACLLLGLDPRTGKVVKTHDIRNIMTSEHHHRCYRNKATENYIIYSRNGLEFADLQSGGINNNRWVRGECGFGIMPANGLIFVPPQPCICFTNVRASGFVAYAPSGPQQPNQEGERRDLDGQRLQRGPAYETRIDAPELTQADWAMYRHDALRSGATPQGFAGALGAAPAWISDLKEPITGPTTGGGKVFVAASKSRRVVALDSKTGSISWAVPVDHCIDTPPTLSKGKVYFGTRGGLVYCLRASDGALVWRFDANPWARSIVVRGRLESAWPVHGSVLVRDGLVYVAAGRSTYLDGGLRLYALDAETGLVRMQVRRDTSEEGVREAGAELTGADNDLLVHDGKNLYLKSLRLDPRTLDVESLRWPYTPFIKERVWEAKFPGPPLLVLGGGFLDDSLYDRSGYVLDQRQSARKLVFRDDVMIGLRWGPSQKGNLMGHEGIFEVGHDHYTIFATTRGVAQKDRWARDVPIRVEAMVLAGDAVYAAGPPMAADDSSTPAFALRSLNGQEGGLLVRLRVSDGKSADGDVCRLSAPPVWDGIAVGRDGLFVATKDGKILKLGAPAP